MKHLLILLFGFIGLTELFAQTAPLQPINGPGGSTYLHDSIRITKFGTDVTDCYWLLEPAYPKPDSAAVIVFWHGTSSETNIDIVPAGQYLFMQHIVRKGYTVIFPLYQYGGATLAFQQQLTNAANVVNMALNELETGVGRVRPLRNHNGELLLGATGISRGGGMTMNAATYHQVLGLPSFKALCAFVPGAGQPMTGIDTSTKVLIVNGEENTVNYAESQEVFDSLYKIPCTNKHLIQVNSDYYGTPDLIAEHNFAGSGHDPLDSTKLNTLDFYGSYKFAVGIFDCAFKNQNCQYCLGNDTLVTYMGHWSDGTPVIPATIKDTCHNIISAINSVEVSQQNILIYPNPTNGICKINIPKDWKHAEVSVYNSFGIRIYHSVDPDKIDLTQQGAGIFFIEVLSGGKIFRSKIVKSE